MPAAGEPRGRGDADAASRTGVRAPRAPRRSAALRSPSQTEAAGEQDEPEPGRLPVGKPVYGSVLLLGSLPVAPAVVAVGVVDVAAEATTGGVDGEGVVVADGVVDTWVPELVVLGAAGERIDVLRVSGRGGTRGQRRRRSDHRQHTEDDRGSEDAPERGHAASMASPAGAPRP